MKSNIPSVEVTRRAAKRLGGCDLNMLILEPVTKRWGDEIANIEALLHEAAHYLNGGGFLVYTHYSQPVPRPALPLAETKVSRVTAQMLERIVDDHLQSVSTFIADADELDACATVQLAGVELGFWSNPSRNPAQINVRKRYSQRRLQQELRLRRRDTYIQSNAKDIALWWKLINKPRKS